VKEQSKNRPIEDFITLAGNAKVFLNSSSICYKMCQQLPEIAENNQILYREIINCAKDLTEKASDFATTFHQMHRLMS
jgi:hypothetical protein